LERPGVREARAGNDRDSQRLRALLQAALDHSGHGGGVIGSIIQRPSHYRSSFPLDELTLSLEDGGCVQLMMKNSNRAALTPEALMAKPLAVYDPLREIEVYRSILDEAGAGTARYFGADIDAASGDHRLFIETVPGVELYQVGELAIWQDVAAWLAGFHARFASGGQWRTGAAAERLLKIDRALMHTWFDRARDFAARRGAEAPIAALKALEPFWAEVVAALTSWPSTLVHGEFYASNVIVDTTLTPLRVCPVDWEMAGIGAGLIDLAALTAGGWSHDQRAHFVDAYVAAAERHGSAWPRAVFDRALTCANAYMAVQWLGWSDDWTPPGDQRQDWASVLSDTTADLRGS
jgi:hypothetical protein